MADYSVAPGQMTDFQRFLQSLGSNTTTAGDTSLMPQAPQLPMGAPTGTPPIAPDTQPQSFAQAHPIVNTLMALGNILGSIGEAQSRGKIKNPAAPMLKEAEQQYTAQQHLDIQNKIQQAQSKMMQERLDLEKQKVASNRVNQVLSFVSKFNIPGPAATDLLKSVVKSDPNLMQVLGDHIDSLVVNPKTKDITYEDYNAAPGQFTDPFTGLPHPGGRVDVTGKPGPDGKPEISKIGPSAKAAEEEKTKAAANTLSGIQAQIITAQATDPATGKIDPAKALEVMKSMRTNPQGVESRLFDKFLQESGGDEKVAAAKTLQFIQQRSFASGAGGQQGQLAVKSTPQYLGNQTDIAAAKAAGTPMDPATAQKVSDVLTAQQQIGNVEQNLDPSFLGPVKGTQGAFEARRRVGSYIGSPVGSKEVLFRQSLADTKDMLLRARSGAQINEQEYKRLASLLPAATDEEPVFKAGLQRFKNEMGNILENKIKLSTTPRGKIGQPAGAPTGTLPSKLQQGGWRIE